jgi:hypothetical protein
MFGPLAARLRTALDLFSNGTLVGRRSALNLIPGTGLTTTVAENVAQNRIDATFALTNTYRQQLTADRTYYVRIDGSDSNNGLANTSGGAFLTIQKAIDTVSALDNGGFNVTIQVGNGTYTQALTLKSYVDSGSMTIQGDTTTPSNVIVSTTSQNGFTATGVIGPWTIQGFRLKTSTAGQCIVSTQGSIINLGKNEFSVCAGNHVYCAQLGQVSFLSSYTINGNSSIHWNAQGQGSITCGGLTITLSGTPAITTFALTTLLGLLRVDGNTFSGSATGTRYYVDSNSVLYTGGAGATYLPGNVAGTTATGGQYL